MHAKLLQLFQSCLTHRDPVSCSQPGSSVHGILQARTLEQDAVPSSRDLPNPGIKPESLSLLTLAGGFFTTSATWEAQSTWHSLAYLSNPLKLLHSGWIPSNSNLILSSAMFSLKFILLRLQFFQWSYFHNFLSLFHFCLFQYRIYQWHMHNVFMYLFKDSKCIYFQVFFQTFLLSFFREKNTHIPIIDFIGCLFLV